jgi:inner membrane protein involved in colicin E2 resistance
MEFAEFIGFNIAWIAAAGLGLHIIAAFMPQLEKRNKK